MGRVTSFGTTFIWCKSDDMNNDVNEDGFVLKQGVGDDGENNKIIV